MILSHVSISRYISGIDPVAIINREKMNLSHLSIARLQSSDMYLQHHNASKDAKPSEEKSVSSSNETAGTSPNSTVNSALEYVTSYRFPASMFESASPVVIPKKQEDDQE